MVVESRPVLRAIIHNEQERADTRLKAIRTVEELAGNLKKNALQVQNNIVNPVTFAEDDEHTLELIDKVIEERGRRGD